MAEMLNRLESTGGYRHNPQAVNNTLSIPLSFPRSFIKTFLIFTLDQVL